MVGMAYGGESVSNNDAGSILHQFSEGILNEEFSSRIDAGGGFVENEEEFGILGKSSCHSEELFLS